MTHLIPHDTKVLTPDGLVNIEDLTSGSTVAQYDLDNGQVSFMPVVQKHFSNRQYIGE